MKISQAITLGKKLFESDETFIGITLDLDVHQLILEHEQIVC